MCGFRLRVLPLPPGDGWGEGVLPRLRRSTLPIPDSPLSTTACGQKSSAPLAPPPLGAQKKSSAT